jgi:imidazole glycerol-phosphate synthase subunit HisH
MINIAVIDYDCGNMYSIIRALDRFNVNTTITHDIDTILSADSLILPGVGSYAEGMRKLNERNLIKPVIEFAQNGKPLLGICLGMQLLVDSSEEFGFHEGLGLISGKTILLRPKIKEKIPHVGWNSIYRTDFQPENAWENTVLNNIDKENEFYFVHSYAVFTSKPEDCLAITKYGDIEFASVIRKNNVFGCQFHPEKSRKIGIDIIKNFLNI